jgi:uncharacterized oxidoreductase
MQMTGNTVLITGATSGIGLAFAEEFLRLKNKVIICGRRKDRLAQIKGKHPDIIARAYDVALSEQREELTHWVLQDYPELNVLVNNAGIQLVTDLTQPVDVSRIRAEMETNFVAPVHLSSLLVPHLASKKDAAIINITSGLAFVPLSRVAVYCASKAAFHSATMSLRYQLRKTPIKVFDIIPPAVDTELGPETRENPQKSHGGISVAEFLKEAMEAIRTDRFEAAVSHAKKLQEKREALFPVLNPPSD